MWSTCLARTKSLYTSLSPVWNGMVVHACNLSIREVKAGERKSVVLFDWLPRRFEACWAT